MAVPQEQSRGQNSAYRSGCHTDAFLFKKLGEPLPWHIRRNCTQKVIITSARGQKEMFVMGLCPGLLEEPSARVRSPVERIDTKCKRVDQDVVGEEHGCGLILLKDRLLIRG
jgi:hypothetical protein